MVQFRQVDGVLERDAFTHSGNQASMPWWRDRLRLAYPPGQRDGLRRLSS